MDPVQQHLNLFITYVDKEGPFLKVWGQAEKNTSIYVEQFLLGASQQFEQGIGKIPFETLQIGTLVCAKYKDDKYYRARIVSIDYLNECFVEVNFVDYGNKDIVPTENLRSLQNFPPSFISIPPLTTGFIFAEAHCPGGGEWKDQIFEIISKELRYREVQCHLLTQATQYYLIKLYIDNTDIGALFINRGLMQPIPLHAQQAVLLSMSMQKKPTVAPVAQAAAPTEINTYKACTLEPLQQYGVYVSFVNEGPTHFSVQLQQSEHMLVKLMKEINEINLRVMEDVPLPGTICLARCQEDGTICRAVVTNEVDNQFKIFYVDFGNYETLPVECLYKIPFKYVLPKVMAIRLALNGVEKPTVTMEMRKAFKKFVDNRLLYMKVLPSDKKTVITKCELWDPETKTSALDVINRAAQHAYPDPLLLNRGFTQPIKVSYVFSCSRFYVQLSSKEQELAKLMEDLQTSCPSNDAIYDIKIGLPCCALFEADQLWYRSEIVDVVDKENVKVRYIDYGNEEVVPILHLRMVEGEMLTVLRPQAIECCLNGYQNMGVDEMRDAFLEELILEQNFTMKVSEMLGKKALVELFDANNYNVASLLLDKIAASKSQVSPMLVQAGNTLEHRKTSDSSDSYRPQRKPARDWAGSEKAESRNYDKTNEKSWRNDNKDTRQNDNNYSNDGFSDGGSWRQNNKGFDRNEKNDRDRGERNQRGERPSINDRFNKNRNDRGNDNKNNNWNNKENGFQNSPSWSSPVNEAAPPQDDDWGNDTPSPVQNSFEGRKPRDDKFGGRKFHDRDQEDRGGRGGWDNKDGGYKKDGYKKDFRKADGSESGSEKSFRKGPRTSSRNDHGGGRQFQNKSNNSFGNASGQDSWSVSDVSTPIDAAPNTATFGELDVVGSEAAVVISWFHNPGHFYCQLQSSQPEFKVLMEEIQQFYKNRKSETCIVGAPVIGLFPEDNVLYRARILEATGGQYKVFYVDFGNVSTISKVWPIEKKFIEMPAQSVCCGLSGIAPNGDNWPDPSIFSKYFGKEFFMARFLEKDKSRTHVQLWDNQDDVSQLLVQANLAVSVAPQPTDGGIEIPLLLNQQFRVVLKSVNNLSDIIVALECGLALTCKAHNLELAAETFEDVLKGYLEQLLIVYVDNILENDLLDVTFYDNDGNKLVILTPDEGALDTVEPLCPILIISSRVYGYVCYANETSVFIQPSVHADQLAALLDQMYEAYENQTEEASIIPEEGFVYAVHSTDGNWYRGRVDSFDDDNATVTYVDYGNSESVAFSELRELKSEMNILNIMCLQVNVTSGSALSFLEKDVVASIYYGETGWEGTVEECATQATQVERLVESVTESEIFADVSEVEENTFVEEIAQTTESGKEANLAPAEEYVESPIQVPETPQNGTPVLVSHIDSPTQFYVQFTESIPALEELQQNLQETAEEMPVLESISVGVLCAAPYSVDHLWYRAEVLDADEDITTVRFIDYGNTDVINNKTTQIKTLPSNLLSFDIYATRCSLKLKAVDDEWSQQALELFEEFANRESVTAEFIIQDEKTNIVELYANGEIVKDALLAKNLAVPCEIVTESKTTCFVSHLNSPSEFWVQMENCVDELEWIAEQLSGAEQFSELDDMSPGTLCAALFPDDEMWYRARILSNTIAGIELLFIDYGNSCVSSSLRQLPEELVITPPLAQKCCLQKPEGIPYWTKEAQDKFIEISAEGQTIFEMKKIGTGETATVELLLSGENIVPRILPVTEDSLVKNFETLDKFSVEKNGELLSGIGLEPMPGMEWNEDSNKMFLELYPDGTVFQVELIGEDCVRLYQNGADIRPQLGGVKSVLNLSNTQAEKTDNISSISEDQVIDYVAGGDNLDSKHSLADSTEDYVTASQEESEATAAIKPVCDKDEQDSGQVDESTDKIKDENSIQGSETDSGHHSEHEIVKEVEKFDSKIDDSVQTTVAHVDNEQEEVTYLEETVAISGENPDEDFEQTTKTEEEMDAASTQSLLEELEQAIQVGEDDKKEIANEEQEKQENLEVLAQTEENTEAISIDVDYTTATASPKEEVGDKKEVANEEQEKQQNLEVLAHAEEETDSVSTDVDDTMVTATASSNKEVEQADKPKESDKDIGSKVLAHAEEKTDSVSTDVDDTMVTATASSKKEVEQADKPKESDKDIESKVLAHAEEKTDSVSTDVDDTMVTATASPKEEVERADKPKESDKDIGSKVLAHAEEKTGSVSTDVDDTMVTATASQKEEVGDKKEITNEEQEKQRNLEVLARAEEKTDSVSTDVDDTMVTATASTKEEIEQAAKAKEGDKEIVSKDLHQESLLSASEPLQNKSTRRSSGIDGYRRSFDDKILPASVSRPHSPVPCEQRRRISYDDKIVPAVVSRPQTPISDDEYEYEGH